jgi:hypothetical protein
MKAAGIILMFGGFAIVPGALALLHAGPARDLFVIAGLALELVGLALAFRGHYTLGEER